MNKEQLNTIFFITLFFVFFQVNFVTAQNKIVKFEKLKLFSQENEIVNGEMWVYQKKFEGHPFWNKNIWYKGYIIYKGKKFENLAIKYDLYTDDVIVFKKVNEEGRIFKLNKQFLHKFAIWDPVRTDTVTFEVLSIPNVKKMAILAKGYEGKTTFYIQYKKVINNIVSDDYTGEYLLKPRLFAKMKDQFVEFDSKSSLLKLFPEKQNEMKKFIRKNKIKIQKKDPENLGSVFHYYDSLIEDSI